MLFYLLEKGVPAESIWGYHDGWDFDRLYRAFLAFRTLDFRKQKEDAVSIAVGASSLLSHESLEKFGDGLEDVIRQMRSGDAPVEPEASKGPPRVVKDFEKLFSALTKGGHG